MASFSFDAVSDYDKSEMNNAIEQAKRELDNRYDFKGTVASLDWLDSDKSGLKIVGDSEYHIDAVLEIVRKKLASRGLSQKVLDTSSETSTSNLKTTKEVRFIKGLSSDNAKKISSLIRQSYSKVKPQIQGDTVRVSSPKKDELQAVMTMLRSQDFDFPIDFTNFR